MKMLCVTEVKIINCDRNVVEIAIAKGKQHIKFGDSDSPIMPVEFVREVIYGKTFINGNYKKVCIGMSKQVQELIGLPFEVFENMQERIFEMETELRANNEDILRMHIEGKELDIWKNYICKMSWFKRFKAVFTGFNK